MKLKKKLSYFLWCVMYVVDYFLINYLAVKYGKEYIGKRTRQLIKILKMEV